jgi:hypothetical protein
MSSEKHKVFITYHHAYDQQFKDMLVFAAEKHDLFIDSSVETGEIDDSLSDQRIREVIRDEYLRDSTVTIVLVGKETKNRKHVDWEIYSSMYDGAVNKKSGILVIHLPGCESETCTAAHGDLEKERIYPNTTNWTSIRDRSEFARLYPLLPDRILDNLVKEDVRISVTNWSKIEKDVEALRFLIDTTFNDRKTCQYDLTRPMRKSNS